ncbi:MAG TPA: cyanophycinase [Planctomycetes bacterium]|jgi:cyanophycinase|nr:cyanophycinase [Planctomycetota bacterium]
MTRGYIIPIGGAEEKISDRAILKKFLEISGGNEARIVVIPTASQLPETGPCYVELFSELGAGQSISLPFEERSDCERKDWLDILENATGVFMTGGNQLRLSTTIGGTSVAEMLRNRNNNHGLHVAGTSAGASIMSEHMIAYGAEGIVPRCDMVSLAPGFGLTKECIVDQHFQQRNRLGRLLAALAFNPRQIGIGLDEDTAAFIDSNDVLEVVGSGAITIVDPSGMGYSSMDSARPSEPVTVIGIGLHILADGCSFDIPNRKASQYPPPPTS